MKGVPIVSLIPALLVVLKAATPSITVGQTSLVNPPIPPSDGNRTACSAYQKLFDRCSRGLGFPHSTHLNATHALRCNIVEGDGCEKLDQELEYTMRRSTWWHCSGGFANCLSRFSQDVVQNLASPDCTPLTCYNHSLPAHFASLRKLAKRVMMFQEENSAACHSLEFSTDLELLANVIVQKSRFCRFDIDLFANMIELVNRHTQAYRKCRRQNGAFTGPSQEQAVAYQQFGQSSSSTQSFQIQQQSQQQTQQQNQQQTQQQTQPQNQQQSQSGSSSFGFA